MSKAVQGSASSLESQVFEKFNRGITSFSVVAPLYYVDEYQSSNGVYYHFLSGDVPVTAYGFVGKYAKENLNEILCRVTGEIRVNQGREGGKAFVNLNADSIVKMWLS